MSTLELDDIQGTVLRQRPAPYFGGYYLLHVSDAAQGRQLIARLQPYVDSAAGWWNPHSKAWLSVAFTYAGLRALGLPAECLSSFAPEFIEGMAARAGVLGDTGLSAPAHWEHPFGTGSGHIALAVFAPSQQAADEVVSRARTVLKLFPAVSVIYELDTPQLPTGRTHLGFVDGIGEPDIEGSGLTSVVQSAQGHYGYLPGFGEPVKAGEFLLGYDNELGRVSPMPSPAVLGRNGTYVSFRKLRIDVAAFRRFLAEHAAGADGEELLAAKMVGRWPSGAPLELAPTDDDPVLAADPYRVNDFTYRTEDLAGLRCPVGAHIRRMNPRDSLDVGTDIKLHRILRRGATYGPLLPEGQTADDGVDRGIAFIFMGTEIGRQFEFVKSQWTNDGQFAGLGDEQDPLVGNRDGSDTYTVPSRPFRRRLTGIPQFVQTSGGEYLFLPGLTALAWLAAGDYHNPPEGT